MSHLSLKRSTHFDCRNPLAWSTKFGKFYSPPVRADISLQWVDALRPGNGPGGFIPAKMVKEDMFFAHLALKCNNVIKTWSHLRPERSHFKWVKLQHQNFSLSIKQGTSWQSDYLPPGRSLVAYHFYMVMNYKSLQQMFLEKQTNQLKLNTQAAILRSYSKGS